MANPAFIPTTLHYRGSYVEFVQAGQTVHDVTLPISAEEIDHLEEKRWFTPMHKAELLALPGCGFTRAGRMRAL